MHSELIEIVAEKEGVSSVLVDMVMTAVFTGVQQAMKHSDVSGRGIDLEYFRIELPYFAMANRLATMLVADNVKFDKHPKDNFDIELLHRALMNIETNAPEKFKEWRLRHHGEFDIDMDAWEAKKQAFKERTKK